MAAVCGTALPNFGALRALGVGNGPAHGEATTDQEGQMPTTVTEAPVGTITVPLEKIYVPENVRELDPEHVDALAGSIALQGQLVPVIVAFAEGDAAEQG